MPLPHFEYFAPATVDEAVALLADAAGTARVLAGGTDLLPRMERHLVHADVLVDLNRIPELRGIRFDPATGLSLGATTRLAEVLEDAVVRDRYPAIAEAAAVTATVQIRNMGTMAGNLCNGSPCADSVPVLMARGAHVEVQGPGGSRVVPLGDFFRGPGETALGPGELVRRIQVPPPPADTGFAFRKLPARTHVDVSAVNVGVMLARAGDACREARIVLGAVGPVPLRARAAEALLAGRTVTAALLQEAGEAAAAAALPISDVRASADYRRAVVPVLVRRALAAAAGRAGLPELPDLEGDAPGGAR
jgi:CO/xanthine dehydrogenase FAD-binding subunit